MSEPQKWTPADFHAHLDKCDRCREQPFNLCMMGAVLLRLAAVSAGGGTEDTNDRV